MHKNSSLKGNIICAVVVVLLIVTAVLVYIKKGTYVDKLPSSSKLQLRTEHDQNNVFTEITIHRDGTFEGYSNEDSKPKSEEEITGVINSCSFHGEFSKIKKLDDHTYDMVLTQFEYYKVAEDSGNMSAYGLKKGVKYVMYFDGASMQGMDKTFLGYTAVGDAESIDVRDKNDLLIGNALWNTKDGYGFFSGWDK
jgi:hypothetical protein